MRIFGSTGEVARLSKDRDRQANWASDLGGKGVEFRHVRKRLFSDEVTESVLPCEVPGNLRWWKRGHLEARRGSDGWVKVDNREDLGELAAFHGLAPLEGLPEPELARMVSDLSARGATFVRDSSKEAYSSYYRPSVSPPSVGSYGAYNFFTGDRKGLERVRMRHDGQEYRLENGAQARTLGYILGCHPRPAGAGVETDSLRTLAAAGLKPVDIDWLALNGPAHEGRGEVSFTLGSLPFDRLPRTLLKEPDRLAARLNERQTLYDRLVKQVGSQEATRTWSDLELHDEEGWAEASGLVCGLLDHGCTRPAGLARWALQAGPAALERVMASPHPDALAAATDLHATRQKGEPEWRSLEHTAERLTRAALTTSELANLADCAQKTCPWRLVPSANRVTVESREISLGHLVSPRVSYLSKDNRSLRGEVCGPSGEWEAISPRNEYLGEGWYYFHADLSRFAGQSVRVRFSTEPGREAQIRNLKVRGADKNEKPGLLRRAVNLVVDVNWNDPESMMTRDLMVDMEWGYGKGQSSGGAPVNIQHELPPELSPGLGERIALFAANRTLNRFVMEEVVFQSTEGDNTARNLLRLAIDPAGDPATREKNFEYLKSLPAPAMLAALEKRHADLSKIRRAVPMTTVLFEDSAKLADRVKASADAPDDNGPQVKVQGDSVVFGGVRIKRRAPGIQAPGPEGESP